MGFTRAVYYFSDVYPTTKSAWEWIIRYKLYHIPFWFVYHGIWWTVAVGNPVAVIQNMFDSPYAVKNLFYIVTQALGVYFNLYFLIPRFLEKRKYVQYVTLVLITILIVATLIVPGYYLSAAMIGQDVTELYHNPNVSFKHFFQANTLPSSAASMTLAMSVKLTKKWLESQQREKILEKEKLETELKFLKLQFHPHFLFNTINSIFVLIRKNPDKASDALEKFSNLMRYQLYECNEKQIELRQELRYVENYFDLQQLRQDENIRLQLQIETFGMEGLSIAPFILVPFVENAFKHVSREHNMDNFIAVHVKVEGRILHLAVRNSVFKATATVPDAREYSGIGLENIRRSLLLAYPDKHRLDIQETNGEFAVKLSVELDDVIVGAEGLDKSVYIPKVAYQ